MKTLNDLISCMSLNAVNNLFNIKKNGKWITISTDHVINMVLVAKEQLSVLGVKPGDRVGIMLESGLSWVVFDLAIMRLGAISVPLFTNASPENVKYIVEETGMELCLTHATVDESVFKKLNIKTISPTDIVSSVQCYAGRILDTETYSWSPNEVSTIIYTSGSTGKPKGVCLTHKNLVSQVHGASSLFKLHATKKDKALSSLPLAHVFERMVMYTYLYNGIPIYFADVRNLKDYFDCQPTVMTAVPRVFEKVYVSVKEALSQSKVVKLLDKYDNKVSRWLKDKLVYRKIRSKFGGKLKYVIVGGAALDEEIERFFIEEVNVPIYTGYGMTECSPVISCNRPGNRKIGSAGILFPGVIIDIAPDGEILVKTNGLMKGYYGQPDLNLVGVIGWFATGDLGYMQDDYLYITGRKKDLMKNSNGKYIPHVQLEANVARHPKVDTCVVIADRKPFTSALIFVEEKLSATELKELLVEANAGFNKWEQIKNVAVIIGIPTPENGLLTSTMKIRREVVFEKYSDIIESLYNTKGKS